MNIELDEIISLFPFNTFRNNCIVSSEATTLKGMRIFICSKIIYLFYVECKEKNLKPNTRIQCDVVPKEMFLLCLTGI